MKWLKKEKSKLRRGYGTFFQKYSKFLIATEAVNTLLSTTNTCKSNNMSTKTKVRREYNPLIKAMSL